MAKQSTNKPTKRRLSLVLFGLTFATVVHARAGEAGEWFYFVKTEPSDPALEAEFNTWYDEIDIPDVLAVPGFERARRAV